MLLGKLAMIKRRRRREFKLEQSTKDGNSDLTLYFIICREVLFAFAFPRWLAF